MISSLITAGRLLTTAGALTPIFLWMVPLAVIAVVVLFFVKEKALAITVEHDVLSESISEGNIVITADDDEVATASR
ncbi:hypothetical protein [[Micrococcus luteus] ATCC 49442]|uniref:hypothetical protein n=1 Tax=[Micrococcus luteus] ATCC 49442 TaxID=2698727 RepID=UPI0013DA59D4|nr:hypothetical protein [[Micrococcus luteus] ATCC 49442]